MRYDQPENGERNCGPTNAVGKVFELDTLPVQVIGVVADTKIFNSPRQKTIDETALGVALRISSTPLLRRVYFASGIRSVILVGFFEWIMMRFCHSEKTPSE